MSAYTLSRDAEIVALCWFGIGGQTTIRFQRPRIIHPRMRAALDELTIAGILARADDPRGPQEWKPAVDMKFSRKFKQPDAKKGESFSMTIDEPGP